MAAVAAATAVVAVAAVVAAVEAAAAAVEARGTFHRCGWATDYGMASSGPVWCSLVSG